MGSHTQRRLVVVAAVLVTIATVAAVGASAHGQPETTTTTTDGNETHDDHGDKMGGMMQMRMVDDGLVVNENLDELPPGCSELNGTRNVTIEAGRQFAEPGNMFTYDTDELDVDQCTKVTVTLVNRDEVRHQWMIHGLPKKVYPMGMFNVEVQPGGRVTGTFITPAVDRTLRTHCSLPQHEQKGMHMQVVVGDGGNGSGGHHGHHSEGGTHDHAGPETGADARLPAVIVLAGVVSVALGSVLRDW